MALATAVARRQQHWDGQSKLIRPWTFTKTNHPQRIERSFLRTFLIFLFCLSPTHGDVIERQP